MAEEKKNNVFKNMFSNNTKIHDLNENINIQQGKLIHNILRN